MPVFSYNVADTQQRSLRGTIVAESARHARDQLREKGLIVRDVADQSRHSASTTFAGRRLGSTIITDFLVELSTLLSVGLPLLEAIDTLAGQARGRLHTAILRLREEVASGSSLAAAFARQPRVFDEMCVSLCEVGEDSGTLDTTLSRLAQFRARREQLAGRVLTVLIYPAIVLAMAIFSSIFLISFIVPTILQPLIEQGQTLPLSTRVIKWLSDLLTGWWWVLVPSALVMTLAVLGFVRTERGRRWLHAAILRTPVLGLLIQKQQMVRIAVVMSTLLRSGVVFTRAIQIAQRATKFVPVRDALKRAEIAVLAGADLSSAMAQGRAIPPTVVQLFAVGQQSGKLEEMLDKLAESYDRQVQTAAARAAAILEPLTIIVLAAIVLTIVLATILPILQAGEVMN